MDIVVSPTSVGLNTQVGTHGAMPSARTAVPDETSAAEAGVRTDPLAAAIRALAAQQAGLAPLLADALVAVETASLPEPVRLVLAQLLTVRPALEGISADQLRDAVERSGLFLEGRIGRSSPFAVDFKVTLLVLRQVLKIWLDGQQGHLSAPSIVRPVDEAAAQERSVGPPPPYRGGPTTGQAVVMAAIDPAEAPSDIGRTLLSDVEGALARQSLLQAASVPDSLHEANTERWCFEIPFALPQGTAIGQFEISGERPATAKEPHRRVWRARFSIDLESTGPVHAQVSLIGLHTSVSLWAERASTASTLANCIGELSDRLRKAALDVGEVMVRLGEPPRPQQAQPSGRFLDRAS